MKTTENFVEKAVENHSLFHNVALKGSSVFVLFLLFVVFATTPNREIFAGESQSRDILEFLGAMTAEQAKAITVAEDSYLVPLKRRVDSKADRSPENYYFLLKGISPMEKRVLNDAVDGQWDHFDLLSASLIVEGVCDSAKIAGYEKQLGRIANVIREKAQKNPSIKDNKEELTKLIFETLHTELLTGTYDIEDTNPAIAFESGNYNCVSATVLFNSLAQKSGLDVCGLEMSGHVLSRAKYGDQVADLETTCPKWFSMKSAQEKRNATLSKIGGTTVKTAKPQMDGKTDELVKISRNTREITDVQLVAAIYYNQGYDHWQANRLPEAAVATAKALLLDPENENAWGNLIGAINNIALGFSMEQKRRDIAAGLLDQIELIDPNFKDLKSNQYHVYSPWVKELVSAGQIDDAKTVYDYAAQRLPSEPRMKTLEKLIR
jgi:tetratricopeptide (TPR) repeat protein